MAGITVKLTHLRKPTPQQVNAEYAFLQELLYTIIRADMDTLPAAIDALSLKARSFIWDIMDVQGKLGDTTAATYIMKNKSYNFTTNLELKWRDPVVAKRKLSAPTLEHSFTDNIPGRDVDYFKGMHIEIVKGPSVLSDGDPRTVIFARFLVGFLPDDEMHRFEFPVYGSVIHERLFENKVISDKYHLIPTTHR